MRVIEQSEDKDEDAWILICIESIKSYCICNNSENDNWRGFWREHTSNNLVGYNWFISQTQRL